MRAKDRRRQLLDEINKTRNSALKEKKYYRPDDSFFNRLNNLERRVRRAGETELNKESLFIELQNLQNELKAHILSRLNRLKTYGLIIVTIPMLFILGVFFLYSTLYAVISYDKLDIISKWAYSILTIVFFIILLIMYMLLRKFFIYYLFDVRRIYYRKMRKSYVMLTQMAIGFFLVSSYINFINIAREVIFGVIYPTSLPFVVNLINVIIQVYSSSPFNIVATVTGLIASIMGIYIVVRDFLKKRQEKRKKALSAKLKIK